MSEWHGNLSINPKVEGVPLHNFTPGIQCTLELCVELRQPGSRAGTSSPRLLLASRPLHSNVLPDLPRRACPKRRACGLIALHLSEPGKSFSPICSRLLSSSSIPELLQAWPDYGCFQYTSHNSNPLFSSGPSLESIHPSSHT